MSRETKTYFSAYGSRIHESGLQVGDVRVYACDFNAALNSGESIQSATWTTDRSSLALSGLDVTDGVASVTVAAAGIVYDFARMVAKATTSTGRTLQQLFDVSVDYQCPAVSTVSWP